ncbi:MAG TPA: hypothetical protein VF730_04675 [Terracidiphilus sp.]
MFRKSLCLLALASLSCISLFAQDKDARDRLFAAHAQYYTPTASGLKSFHCDASIDWKAMLSRFSGTDVADDNPALQFLNTVHLAVDDDLRGKGQLEWTNTAEPPADRKPGLQQMQEGLQTSVAGFFQSWNAYMNGSMVPLPDNTVTVTTSGDGVHLSGKSNDATFDEDYDKNMLLTKVAVVTPSLSVLATPVYTSSESGLILSSMSSEIHQPPTAPASEAVFRIEYEKVDAFQIPSHVVLDIRNTGTIEIGFSACKVTVADWAKKN